MQRSVLVASLLLSACKDADPPASAQAPSPGASQPHAGTELPKLARTGTIDAPSAAPVITATPQGITLNGTPVIALRDGKIDPADLEGGANGRKITKLTAQLSMLSAGAPPSTLALALDPRVSYELLHSILFSAKQKEAGWKHFALLVTTGGRTRALPLTLPDKLARPRDDVFMEVPDEQPPVGGRHDHTTAARVHVLQHSTGAEQVRAKIQSAYLAQIKRCYRDELRKDPVRRGKLTLTVRVSSTGSTKRSTAVGLASACVQELMQRWRFPIPKDVDGEPTPASFEVTLQLVPDEGTTEPSPTAPPVEHPPQPPTEPPLRLVVTATAKELRLWSISGLEGTLSQPKLTIPRGDAVAMTKLGDALRELVQRRWAGTQRPEDSRDILLMAPGETPMQVIAELIAAVRETADGQTLFPDVLLSTGFE